MNQFPGSVLLSLSLLVGCQTSDLQLKDLSSLRSPSTQSADQNISAKPILQARLQTEKSHWQLKLSLPPLAQRQGVFQTQALAFESDYQVLATLTDSHGRVYLPSQINQAGYLSYPPDGQLMLDFNQVLTDSLLLLELHVQTASGRRVPQAELALAVSYAGQPKMTAPIDFQSSAVARTLKSLMGLDAGLERARQLDLMRLNHLMEAITGPQGQAQNRSYLHNHPSLVQTDKLAAALLTQSPDELLSNPQALASFRGQGAQLNLEISGLEPQDRLQVQITDAASPIYHGMGNVSHERLQVTPGKDLRVLLQSQPLPAQQYAYTLEPAQLPELKEGQAYGLRIVAQAVLPPHVRVVKTDATGLGNGRSWEDAYTHLQTALAEAKPGQEIWLAAGVYTPHAEDKTISFDMKDDVAIYGGFAGTELKRELRDWQTNPVILSGDLKADDDCRQLPCAHRSDNSLRVLNGASALLDGVTVKGGHGEALTDHGVGLFVGFGKSPTLRHVTFTENTTAGWGGAVRSMASTGTFPVFENVHFYRNTAGYGGGLYGSGTLKQVKFTENTAKTQGGGLYNSGSNQLTDVHFEQNTAAIGAGMSGGGTLTRVSFNHNQAMQSGGGLYAGQFSALNQVSFYHNAALHGAGLYSAVNTALDRVAFHANKATSYGGGMHVAAQSFPSLLNVSFSNNSATSRGGGLYLAANTLPELNHVTFSNNLAGQGGGIYLSSPSSIHLKNTLFWNSALHNLSLTPGDNGNYWPATSPFVNDSDPLGSDGLPQSCDDGLYLHPSQAVHYVGLPSTPSINTDLTGLTRHQPPRSGAYEIQTSEAGVCP